MAALVVGGLVVWGVMRPAPQPPAPIARFLIPLGAGEVFAGTNDPIVALSPAGTHVGYTANDGLVLRTLDQLEARPISGTLGALNPFFSPDGQQLGFYAPGVRLEPTPPMADRTVLLDDDRALQRRVPALIVIVIAAGTGGVEVTRLTALAG